MKYIIAFFIIISALFISCEKELQNENSGFVKSFPCDSDVVTVGTIQLADNTILIICRADKENTPGYLYKIDAKGNLIFTKRLSDKNIGLRTVFDTPGAGFATIGFADPNADNIQICLYDDDGNFISNKEIFTLQNFPSIYWGPCQALALSNGNYLLALGCGGQTPSSYFIITDNSFNVLHSEEMPLPANHYGLLVRGAYEMPDATIALSVASGAFLAAFPYNYYFNTYILRTDLNLNLLSNKIIKDTLHNETPNALLPVGNKFMIVSGRMGQTSDGDGVFVNYYGHVNSEWCSGEINLVQIDDSMQLATRKAIRNYPAICTL